MHKLSQGSCVCDQLVSGVELRSVILGSVAAHHVCTTIILYFLEVEFLMY